MKKEIPPGFFYVVIALLVVGAGWALYYYSEAPFSRPGSEEAQYFEVERMAKAKGVDMRKDPMAAMEYYKHHPEEKPPGGKAPSPPGPGGAGQIKNSTSAAQPSKP